MEKQAQGERYSIGSSGSCLCRRETKDTHLSGVATIFIARSGTVGVRVKSCAGVGLYERIVAFELRHENSLEDPVSREDPINPNPEVGDLVWIDKDA